MKRKVKGTTKLLKILMIVLAIIFLVLGITLQTGYMAFCFVFALLYFVFEANAYKDYEYVFENFTFKVTVIKAKRRRYLAHEIDLSGLEVIAPHDHEAVRMYKKGNGNSIAKFDYTSYEDDVPYYTMIVYENKKKIKLLLDLNDEMLLAIKQKYPSKVYR